MVRTCYQLMDANGQMTYGSVPSPADGRRAVRVPLLAGTTLGVGGDRLGRRFVQVYYPTPADGGAPAWVVAVAERASRRATRELARAHPACGARLRVVARCSDARGGPRVERAARPMPRTHDRAWIWRDHAPRWAWPIFAAVVDGAVVDGTLFVESRPATHRAWRTIGALAGAAWSAELILDGAHAYPHPDESDRVRAARARAWDVVVAEAERVPFVLAVEDDGGFGVAPGTTARAAFLESAAAAVALAAAMDGSPK